MSDSIKDRDSMSCPPDDNGAANEVDTERRKFIRKAAYAAPTVTLLSALPNFARASIIGDPPDPPVPIT